ncbi:extracellular matrix organizing protein FRAS1 [Pantherophis guttatus]|uniref:Extracellular matrix organizing protein FRAS1 n=1 Tax=Pantherophis guttatus TaxID=94885 RepID=A0ABM3Z3P5_PANGU|nr:extracellular matrix organizing protein FRAS1 [Pantherophis guttatus]
MDCPAAFLLALALLVREAEGTCFYQGLSFENNTVWKPDSCQECGCHGDIVLCEAVACRDPRCNFEKEEILQISPNSCCPECAERTEGFCEYEGQLREPNAEWASSGCRTCSCANGEVTCAPQRCSALSCEDNEVEHVGPGECCPKCVSRRDSCSFDGEIIPNKKEWRLSPCAKCVCRDGSLRCFTIFCPPAFCSADESLVVPAGKCCPECARKPCFASGALYQHGEEWKKDACTTCVCDTGESRCFTKSCLPLNCRQEENKVRRPGKCCEECVLSEGSCVHNGTLKYHSDMWHDTDCNFCTCDGGRVACRKAKCARVDCGQGEELSHLPGKCCPECISRGGPCIYKDSTKDSGEKWKEGLCRECECLHSKVNCYSRSCLTCPPGSVAVAVHGECCPQCKPGRCHPDCLTCAQAFDRCDACRESTKFLLNGRCVDSCGVGFYPDAGLCVACKELCSTCTNKFGCTSCQASLHLKDAQCVTSCGERFFPGPLQCTACHESCATCRGPTANNCSTCRDPSLALLEGTCVANCGQRFYVTDGVCRACQEGCDRCYLDRLRCLSCASGRVLLDGNCLSECPHGYYADGSRKCRVCHSSCTGCTGPLPTQCTSCSFPQAFYQGRCLLACGEGFYQHHNLCKGCHSSCRACVGPEHSHCTRCTNPEEKLQPYLSLEERPVGACLPQCRAQFYSNEDGICKACHSSCLSCTGGSPENCTICASPQVFHEGRCISECPEGWYHQESRCYACHPSCKTCSGAEDDECTACHPHASFLNGRCRTPCKREQYLNLVGYCAGCHPLCELCVADLHTDRGSTCLRCRDIHHLLLKDRCVPDCPVGFYQLGGECQKCHPSCKTCTGEGPFSCTSCDASLVLSHAGSCLSACSLGFYQDDNLHCKPCSDSCLSCDSRSHCTSCKDPSKVLLFGECQYDKCPSQYFLDVSTRTCKECDWSCNVCHGPNRTDCLQCMEGYFLQQGACVEHCLPAFFRESETCQRCVDDHCLQCDGPRKCVRCQAPFLLLDSQCVLSCGKRYYGDHGGQICLACPEGCLECDGSTRCRVCNSTTFLQKGLCVADCGRGVYNDPRNRQCKSSGPAPGFKAKSHLLVGIGGLKLLDGSLMEVENLESYGEGLLFRTAALPTNGRLMVLAEGKESEQDHFTWEDVKEQRVFFVHDKMKSRNGQFFLTLSYQESTSEPVMFTVRALSTQAPYVFKNEVLLVSKGDAGTITSHLLDIQDRDNPQDVTVTILDPPKHGQLVKLSGNGPLTLHVFSLGELSGGFVHYIHDGSNSLEDMAVLQVSDGYHFQNILFRIKIDLKSNRIPRLVISSTVWVPEGGMLQITKRNLQAEMFGASDSAIIYTIRDKPQYGEVVFLVPMPADDSGLGWQPLANGGRATPTTTFTQQDINEGVIWYRHSGAETESDSFRFQVSGAGFPQTHLETHLFNIAILPPHLASPVSSSRSSFHMTALEDRVTPIQPHQLSFVNSQTPSEEITYNVTVPLPPNQGMVEHRDKPFFPVAAFTQTDINNGKIVYRPPSAASHIKELMEFSFAGLPESINFRFTVSDGEHISPEMAFTIHLLSTDVEPPLFQITTPVLEVSQGGRAAIGIKLTLSDGPIAAEDLFFEVVEPPHHGALLRHGSGFPVYMATGDSFTYEEITRNALHYLHDGSSSGEDSMEISVTDGSTKDVVLLKVKITPVDINGPRLDPSCSLSITVAGKNSVIITRSHFAYIDNNSPDSEIRIQLISLPMYGSLMRTAFGRQSDESSEVYNFTMEDINHQTIRYFTELETVFDQPITDVFYFSVFDADNNQLDSQMFTVTITAAQNVPPVITFSDQITVEEGGRTPLHPHHTLRLEGGLAEEGLVVKITSPPKYGYIENTRTGRRLGFGNAESSDFSFSLQDVLENRIYYFQNVHESIEPSMDSFGFYISDGFSQSEISSVNITIKRLNDEPPQVKVSPISVRENTAVVIRNSSLRLRDLDTPNDLLVFMVTKIPIHGYLYRRESPQHSLENGQALSEGSTFTYQDVLEELIVYKLNSLVAQRDEFQFSLSDGLHIETGKVEFAVASPRMDLPTLVVNRGLQLPAGSVAVITNQHLRATDPDSDDLSIKYIMKKDPIYGLLHLHRRDSLMQISARGPAKSFTQADINKGQVEYSHEKEEPVGTFFFVFDVTDGEGNRMADLAFSINVTGDQFPLSVTVNTGLILDENSVRKITPLELSAKKEGGESSDLLYRIIKQPQLGHLEHATLPGRRISSFQQEDLVSHSLQYIHTSEAEEHADAFTFTVSDGRQEVTQNFEITINPVDDSLPVVQAAGTTVQEGVRKTITEFDLKATDADTEAKSVTFSIVQSPRHGQLERTHDGHHYQQAHAFSMEDVFQNRISYSHDGSNFLEDRFTFTVSDGTNPFFVVAKEGKEIVTAVPQWFRIEILPVDDGTPRVVTNLGLQWLEYMNGKPKNLITKKELLTMDPDTEDNLLIYEITTGTKYGYVEKKLQPGTMVTTFTQEDVNLGLIQYVLHEENIQRTEDSFQFLVKDSKPSIVADNIFHIQWSVISFQHTSYNISEKAGSVSVAVRRAGNLKQYAIVLCRTEQGTATSSSSSQPGEQDYLEYASQVQFDEWEDLKTCTIVIHDDGIFEGVESFTVELSMPAYALLGNITATQVFINDVEDEPTLQFDKKVYHTSESAGILSVPIERKGDSSSIVSAICYTVSQSAQGSSMYALESGSDFKSRGMSNENRVILGPGVTMTTCDVKLVDDSEYEEEEEFEIALTDVSENARLGSITSAKVTIDGPNDASTVSLGSAAFSVSEEAGIIEIPITRHGSDLSIPTSVWCATRTSDPPSATPGFDYIPSSKKVEFHPGRTEEYCTLTILDDAQSPVIEGVETFVVYLSSPQGAELAKPFQAVVAINDTFQDVPNMKFSKDVYSVKEKDHVLHIPVIRSGDLSYESSVRCHTQSQTARVMEDFEERRNAEESRITFLKGEKVKNCTIIINDDSAFEPEERFRVYLSEPQGSHWSGATVGKSNMATVVISNDEDAPTIEFEEAGYQVREPPGPEGVGFLNVKVIRRGDQNRTSKVRCSTRDGSAQSGIDYYPKSRVLKFSPGVDHVFFKVEIMSNEDREWHESFSLVLGPDDPIEAVLGDLTTTIVTILDQEAAGSLILPAPPIVVTLSEYDHVEEETTTGAKKSPSPGYPLVCVTPCDSHFPKYSVMKERCGEAGINQSSIQFSWEVATPTDGNGARSPFETITDNTPFTSVNHMVLDSIYFSRRFHVRCVTKAVDKVGHVGTPLRSNIVTIGTDSAICHTPVVAGTARGFQAQSFIATLKYLDVKHKEHPNRIHISVQIPHQDGMLPLISTRPLHNLHFLLSESIYRHQHVCSNIVSIQDLKGISEAGFLDEVMYNNIVLGPGYDRPYQFDPSVREPKTIQFYKHLNLKSCIWTFDAYYDMTELIDVCGGSVTADFQVRDSAQSFLTVHVPLYVSYVYVTAPRGWASLEHHTEMEFSFFYDTILWRTGIQTDSVLSAKLQIIRIYIRDDGRLVIEFKTHAKFRGHFVMEHHTLPNAKSFIMTPDHLGGMEFDLQLLWSGQTFDSPYQLWRATSSYSRKDYSGEYTISLIPCTVQPTQSWVDPGDKPLPCTAHAPEKFLIPIAFQQTNRPVPVVYSLNTEFQLCNNEKVFLMDPTKTEMSMAEMDYKGAFSKGQILYGRVMWNPEQNLNSAYKLQLEKVYLCTGKDGYVPFFDPTGTIYNEGPQYGCIQPSKHLKHRFLLLDRSQPEVTDKYFHDVPFDAYFASELADFHQVSNLPGVDGFVMKVDALYKVEAGHQWYLQVIYVIGPEMIGGSRMPRSVVHHSKRGRRDLVDHKGVPVLDDSLIYDNEGDQMKNGTNMKSLSLEQQEAVTVASLSQTGASIGSGFAAVLLLVLVLLSICFVTRKCRKHRKKKKKKAAKEIAEQYPLNTKVEAAKRYAEGLEKNVSGQYCTVKNLNLLCENEGAYKVRGTRVKQMNLEVKVHNNLHDGTEV